MTISNWIIVLLYGLSMVPRYLPVPGKVRMAGASLIFFCLVFLHGPVRIPHSCSNSNSPAYPVSTFNPMTTIFLPITSFAAAVHPGHHQQLVSFGHFATSFGPSQISESIISTWTNLHHCVWNICSNLAPQAVPQAVKPIVRARGVGVQSPWFTVVWTRYDVSKICWSSNWT